MGEKKKDVKCLDMKLLEILSLALKNESSRKRALEKLNFWAYDPVTEREITLPTSSAAQKAVEYGICPKI